MMKMLIKLDEEKIEREGEYDLKKIKNFINGEISRMGIYKDEEGLYTNGNFVTFGSMVLVLSETDWFMDNATEWLWYDSEGQADPNAYGVEDLLEHYKKRRRRSMLLESKNYIKQKRAINFDLGIEKLMAFYSKTNPKGAYKDIYNYFIQNGFEYRQGYGYCSKIKLTNSETLDIVNRMFKEMPWLDECSEKIDATNIGEVYDIKNLRAMEQRAYFYAKCIKASPLFSSLWKKIKRYWQKRMLPNRI